MPGNFLKELESPFSTLSYRRVVSYYTFAINWYFGKDNPSGFRLVNILIHISTSLLLFKTIELLFRTPVLIGRYSRWQIYHVAALAALIWAVHPINIQAVTYIVQRMASLSALFYLASLYFYLKCRISESRNRFFAYAILSVAAYFLAIGSKEHTVLLPFVLVILEYSFFISGSSDRTKWTRMVLVVFSVAIVICGVLFLVLKFSDTNLFENYGNRNWSIFERLITQPRVLIFYLSLIFYPLPIRYSITHDIEHSINLFSPWSTFPSILALILLFCAGVFLVRKYPLLGFPILFFLINHLVESSIIPLEIVFEHRNYLPSLFLFIPLVLLILRGIEFYKERNLTVTIFIYGFLVGIIFLTGWGTYLRNNNWSSHQTLWAAAHKRAPDNSRPLAYLGQIHGYEKIVNNENVTRALQYYKAMEDKYHNNKLFQAYSILNIANIYHNIGEYEKAEKYYIDVLEKAPYLYEAILVHGSNLLNMGKFQEAIDELEKIVSNKSKFRSIPRTYSIRGKALLWQGKPIEAIVDFSKAIHSTNKKSQYFYYIGVAYSLANEYEKASMFLRWAQHHYPSNMSVWLSRIENAIRSDNEDLAMKLTEGLIESFNFKDLQKGLEIIKREGYSSVPINLPLIEPYIKKSISNLNHKLFN